MKIWLEKPAVNISQLTGGKNEKVRRGGGLIWKTSVRFIFCLQETLNGNQNNWICDMSTRGFLIEILLHIYNVQQTEVISGFLFTFITHKFWEQLVIVFTVSKCGVRKKAPLEGSGLGLGIGLGIRFRVWGAFFRGNCFLESQIHIQSSF